MASLLFFCRRPRWSSLMRRYCTAITTQSESEGQVDQVKEPSIPMVPKKRDPTAVLKALASTVEPTEYEMFDGTGPGDPLYPFTMDRKMSYVKHQEAGRQAAEHVLKQWPELFKLKKLDTDPLVDPEQDLEYFISKQDVENAVIKYNELKEKGESVPLETKNDLLALVAYFGVDSDDAATPSPPSKSFTDISWWVKGEQSGSHQVGSSKQKKSDDVTEEEPEGEAEGEVEVPSWNSLAEKLYSEDFEEKDGQTYEAMIQGLIKHKNYNRAFQLFDEMRSQGYQAQTGTYNSLLSAISDPLVKDTPKWTTSQTLVKHMDSKIKVAPNTETFNHLLRMCSNHETLASDLSLQVLREMLHVKVEPSLGTFYLVLNTFSNDDKAHCVVEEMVDYLESNPSVIRLQCADCLKFFSTAMYACSFVPNSSAGLRLFKLYRKHGNSGLVERPFPFMKSYMMIVARSLDTEQIIEEYHRLVPNIYIPLESVYSMIIKKLFNHKEMDFIRTLWRDIKRFRVEIRSSQTVHSIANVVGSKKVLPEKTQEYFTILEEAMAMVANSGETPTIKSISTAITLAHKLSLPEKAWYYYQQQKTCDDPLDWTTILVLLRCFQKPEYKDRVLELFREMTAINARLPRSMVLEICQKANIDSETSDKIAAELTSKMFADVNSQMDDYEIERKPLSSAPVSYHDILESTIPTDPKSIDAVPGSVDEASGSVDESPGSVDEASGSVDEASGSVDEASGSVDEAPYHDILETTLATESGSVDEETESFHLSVGQEHSTHDGGSQEAVNGAYELTSTDRSLSEQTEKDTNKNNDFH